MLSVWVGGSFSFEHKGSIELLPTVESKDNHRRS